MEVTNNERDISSCTTAADINGGALSLLPPEILVNIFSFFSDSVKDLLLCAQVNQTWHHIITSFYIWRTVKFNKFETFSRFHEILQLITKTRRNRALDNWSRFVKAYLNVIKSPISRTSEEEYEEEEEKDVGAQISFTKPTYFYSTKFYGYFVKKLDLSRIHRKNLITEEMLRDLFPNIPNLENVNFYNCYTVTDRKLKLFGCTSLTNRSLYWIEMRCSKLTTLNIGFCVIITPNALQSLVNRCKELTSLTISHCLNTRAISLIPMVKNLQGLRKLYMHSSFTSDLIVKNIISQIPSLRKLDLGISNPKLTDEATNIISRHCPNLVYLSLSFSLITRLGLRTIGRGCRKLLFIDLSGCYLIDDEISDFLSYCPRLKIIYLNYLLQISGKSFLSIIKSSQIEYASFTSSKILEVSSSIDLLPPSSNEERSCSKIRKLVLDNCEISDKNLKQISYWCKNLEYLDISLVYDMDDRVLQDLCDRLENLKEVIAKNCYGVSVAMQDNLSKHQRIKFTF
ncbi:F-box/LRR-repeat protein 2 [Rhizophagus irregularis]|uniref:F-box/LRR-repeat protein 2 n=1 Tax=Rhizophagus irregularis TaxID=588596 RepID=A0A2N1NEW0_9GLOM|nr:F-box/LRR-repeat protein 2 [Rhizophagus irregularis]